MKTLIFLVLISQFPNQPSKTQPEPLAAPSKAAPLASPQATTFASPQQTYQAATVQAQVVLRAVPQVYAIHQVVVQADPVVYSQVAVQAAPVVSYATVAYASDPCVVQQQVVRQTVLRQQVVQHSAVVNYGTVQQSTVNHALGGAGRQPRKVVTKQITKTKRGLFGF